MKKLSEFQCLALLRSGRAAELDALELYKACVTVANSGLRLPEEEHLSKEAQSLLEIRRGIYEWNGAGMEERLQSLRKLNLSDFFEGDRKFLIAQIQFRKGLLKEAAGTMIEAASHFFKVGDRHRELRARTNSLILLTDLTQCIFGDLVAFEQDAMRSNYFDLAGNICRARSHEFLVKAKYEEARDEAYRSVAHYELDGFPDDKSVSLLTAAIAHLLLGEIDQAKAARTRAWVTNGKVLPFVQAYEALSHGTQFSVDKSHPLHFLPIKPVTERSNSVSGKIVGALQKRPRSRDELITEVWGQAATHPSYCSRLYTAINGLRKQKNLQIIYDGEFYRLVG